MSDTKTQVSLDAAEAVMTFLRASYQTALTVIGLTDEEVNAVEYFVDSQLRMAKNMVEEKMGLDPSE